MTYFKHGKNIVIYLVLKRRYIVRNVVLVIIFISICNVNGNLYYLDGILKVKMVFCPKKYYQSN